MAVNGVIATNSAQKVRIVTKKMDNVNVNRLSLEEIALIVNPVIGILRLEKDVSLAIVTQLDRIQMFVMNSPDSVNANLVLVVYIVINVCLVIMDSRQLVVNVVILVMLLVIFVIQNLVNVFVHQTLQAQLVTIVLLELGDTISSQDVRLATVIFKDQFLTNVITKQVNVFV